MDEKTIGATMAKTHFLSLLTEIELKRTPIVVTRNGKRVARLMPLPTSDDPLAIYRFGGAKIVGDVISPVDDANDWELD